MLSVFWNVVTVLSTAIEWIVLKLVLDETSNQKVNKIKINTSFAIATLIIIVLTIINFEMNLKLLIGIVISYIVYVYNYDVSGKKALFVILIYYLLLMGFDIIGISLVGFLNNTKDMGSIIGNNIYGLELIILSKFLLTLIVPIIKIFKIDLSNLKKDYMDLVIPISTNIISIVVIFGYILRDENTGNVEHILIIVLSIVFLFSNISIIKVVGRLMNESKIEAENKLIKEKMDMQYKYYSRIQESQEKTRSLYHDMNNHILCIKSMYENNEVTNDYIKDIEDKIKSCGNTFSTQNMILDVILEEEKSICEKNNIEFEVDLNFEKGSFVEATDLCSIFSNMLDNAIEACKKIESSDIKRKIKLRGAIVNKYFVIRCENTKVNPINIDKDNIITDKKDSFLHGIGISSIRNSVEKYNGNVEIKTEENRFVMIIYIPIDIN